MSISLSRRLIALVVSLMSVGLAITLTVIRLFLLVPILLRLLTVPTMLVSTCMGGCCNEKAEGLSRKNNVRLRYLTIYVGQRATYDHHQRMDDLDLRREENS